jgi:hypothetical protein
MIRYAVVVDKKLNWKRRVDTSTLDMHESCLYDMPRDFGVWHTTTVNLTEAKRCECVCSVDLDLFTMQSIRN